MRACHPVANIGRFLLGAWQVTRLGWDGMPARTMRLRGTARFSACAAGLLFEERGTMAAGTYLGEAVRRYIFRLEGDGAADVCFEDGRLFHPINLEAGVAHVRHDCAPDRYEGRYRVLTPACWLLSWRVTGPRKNYRVASRFIRKAPASPREQPAGEAARPAEGTAHGPANAVREAARWNQWSCALQAPGAPPRRLSGERFD